MVWSSLPPSEQKKNDKVVPFGIDKTPNLTNLKMLRGEYPQKWLGDWLAEKQKKKKSLSPLKRKLKRKRLKNSPTNESPKEIQVVKRSRRKLNKAENSECPIGKLREIIIDGPNVAKE